MNNDTITKGKHDNDYINCAIGCAAGCTGGCAVTGLTMAAVGTGAAGAVGAVSAGPATAK